MCSIGGVSRNLPSCYNSPIGEEAGTEIDLGSSFISSVTFEERARLELVGGGALIEGLIALKVFPWHRSLFIVKDNLGRMYITCVLTCRTTLNV